MTVKAGAKFTAQAQIKKGQASAGQSVTVGLRDAETNELALLAGVQRAELLRIVFDQECHRFFDGGLNTMALNFFDLCVAKDEQRPVWA